METANLVTYPELLALLGIFSGIWLAVLSVGAAWHFWDSNRRDKQNDRRHKETEKNNERRHQELLQAIGLLYKHVHADGSPAIVPLGDIDLAITPPASTPAAD